MPTPASFPLVGLSIALAALLRPGCARPPRAHAPEPGTHELRVDDRFAFSPDRLACSPGQPLRLRIHNAIPPGGPDLPHNVVLLRIGADVESFAQAGVNARAEHNYIPAAFFDQVITASGLVHPGKTVELVLAAPSTPGDYPLICSFPGHCLLGMRGVLAVR